MKRILALLFASPLVRIVLISCVLSVGISYINHRMHSDMRAPAVWERTGHVLGSTALLSLLLHARQHVTGGQQAKWIGVWVLFFLFVLVLYSFRADLVQVK